MWVVVGLGNPGPRYAHTRHNAGFLVVDSLARRWRIPMELDVSGRLRHGSGTIRDRAVMLMQPQTYMNCSGEPIAGAIAADDQVIAVFDDLDLPEGGLRVRGGGGAGGHRGVASLLEHVGDRFLRVRVGIGRPSAGEDVAAYVLEPLAADAAQRLADAAERAADAIECVLVEGLSAAMNRFNARPASASAPV